MARSTIRASVVREWASDSTVWRSSGRSARSEDLGNTVHVRANALSFQISLLYVRYLPGCTIGTAFYTSLSPP